MEVLERVAFYVMAVIAVASALLVVVNRNPVASAMSLVGTFLAVAGLYLTLNATFLSAIQVLVYAGAIMVLFLFVIMLLNLEREPFDLPGFGRIAGFALSVVLLFSLISLALNATARPETSARGGSGAEIGDVFFSDYLFPFEMASLLLLVAMVGVIVVARRRKPEEEEEGEA